MKFLNRKEEIAHIRLATQSEKSSFVIVYGRRRIGKSTLIQKALKKSDIYYIAQVSDDVLQRELFAKTVARKIKGFDTVIYPDWNTLFEQLSARITKRLTLCIDEFPYIIKTSPGLPSVLQKWLDGNKEGKINLVICGSSQQMMKGFAFDSSNPLYGRARKIMKIEPLLPGYIIKALNVDFNTAVEEYSVWGGIPRYWELRSEYKNMDHAVTELVLNKFGPLHDEPVQLFIDDMRESVQSFSIMTVIGAGCNRLTEIATRLNKPATHLTRPIETLINLGYIHREIPFGENPHNTKRSLYKISDPFLAFYFKIIVPNKSLLQLGKTTMVLNDTREILRNHVAAQWENICRLAVSRLKIGNAEFSMAQRWWNNQTEIDVLALSEDKTILLAGECKWSHVENPEYIVNKLIYNITNTNLAKGKKLIIALFVKSAVKTGKNDYFIFTAEDVINILL